ncbi:hypothetical protein PM076_12425 [Halorubrum ezzemoulense]|jgi:hypothetical protein|uniref:Uncharacterized protein n=1 Tax=Halorubrum ezzemoulense TaxID=337243 RepID=A0A256JLX7_HALEZ|nr:MULTISPECIES: hypothetical protein [Halorubrum]MDB2238713.1 hypothetical protein [Halorubrum ezzemoulense]MDB2239770.1 hypothetical protein [Halorubrum ezzemoulense]MDB2244279.1 hypothetical protein [Halorubrum ezzemoulense]MDB2248021.1 hypothetical protein [Halorubrum ezzemoulense]MDB2252275.1 hypothetical protein [Halorubrum ezzemoulense]
MVLSASAVSLVSVSVTVLMVAAMLYLVWGSLDSDIHTPSPGSEDHPELDDDGDDSDEASGELPDGNAA